METTAPPATPANARPFEWKRMLLWSDIAVFLALVAVAAIYAPATAWKTAELGLAAIGFFFWMLARYQLGRSFTATAQARRLVNTGLYRRFRHPIYYFGTIAHLGMFLALQIWWLPVIWLAYSSAIQWKRMQREDKVLEEAFGEEFRELRKGTWF